MRFHGIHTKPHLEVGTIPIRHTSSVNLDMTKELENRECSVSAEERDEDDDDTRSTKKSKLSAVSGDNPAFDSNMSEPRESQPDHAQSP